MFQLRARSATSAPTSPSSRKTINAEPTRGKMCIIMSPRSLMMILGLVINALLGALLADALKVSVSIPEIVKINEPFWLNCSHNVVHSPSTPSAAGAAAYNQLTELGASRQEGSGPSTSERIYSIKWYKDEEEFYRFLPHGEPKVLTYDTDGISLDQTKSHEGNVYLTKAVVNTEGTYRCEVLSEPLFETVRKSRHLRVYALPVKGPRIEILDAKGGIKNPKAQDIHYNMGDKIELRCNSPPSKPAVKLKWFLNDRELITANGSQQSINTTAEWPLSRTGATNDFQPASLLSGPATSMYNVSVSPVEYRQHYKGIYSSHSSISMTLQAGNLINRRISFKCLASMRQEVPIASKQLIVLAPRRPEDPQTARLRARSLELIEAAEQRGGDSATTPRFRAQYNTRPPSAARTSSQIAGGRPTALDIEFINSLAEDDRQQALMYIYEDADSTLGPSIIDGPETLERYLASQLNQSEWLASSSLEHHQLTSAASNNNKHASLAPVDFNRGDNLEYVQMMRDRHSRQRSIPGTNNHLLGHHRRLWGANTNVKGPLYLDEFDPLRPVINWPPFESGKLILLPPSHSIVAIPTPTSSSRSALSTHHEMKFVLPPGRAIADQQRTDSSDFGTSSTSKHQQSSRQVNNQAPQVSQLLLERLIANLNCTSTESSIETRLSWQVNEVALNARDTRHFPTRISPDHKQTWLSIGLQQVTPASSSANSLVHILSQYYPKPGQADRAQADALRSHTGGSSSRFVAPTPAGPQMPAAANEQLKIMCQATHSMLLYSSSEIITFDFNPPPDEHDKLAALPSNVITAATASQTKSASSPSFANLISQGSHLQLAPMALATTLLSVLLSRAQTIVCR